MQSSRHSTEFRCRDCGREFNSSDALDQHRASLAHRRLGTVYCLPCRATFPSPSAVLQHRESGACLSGVNRDEMQAWIMKHNVGGVTTQPPADHGSSVEAGSGLGSRLSFSSAADGCLTPTSGSLSDWGGLMVESSAHRCPLCPLERRPFQNAIALRQHIESAAHIEKCFQAVGIEFKLAKVVGIDSMGP